MARRPQTYRVYCYDATHRVLTADLIEAATDEEAIVMAEMMGFGSKCEIWEGKRLVATLTAERRHA